MSVEVISIYGEVSFAYKDEEAYSSELFVFLHVHFVPLYALMCEQSGAWGSGFIVTCWDEHFGLNFDSIMGTDIDSFLSLIGCCV